MPLSTLQLQRRAFPRNQEIKIAVLDTIFKLNSEDVYICRVQELPGVLTVTAAGTGGLLYWLAIYPIDQIKSAIMTDSINPAERKYPDMATAFRVSTRPAPMVQL